MFDDVLVAGAENLPSSYEEGESAGVSACKTLTTPVTEVLFGLKPGYFQVYFKATSY